MKFPKNETCPRCGSTGRFEQIQHRIYSPPMAKQKLISRIARCLECNEMVGTVSKYRLRRECEEDV